MAKISSSSSFNNGVWKWKSVKKNEGLKLNPYISSRAGLPLLTDAYRNIHYWNIFDKSNLWIFFFSIKSGTIIHMKCIQYADLITNFLVDQGWNCCKKIYRELNLVNKEHKSNNKEQNNISLGYCHLSTFIYRWNQTIQDHKR
jgi:hypothetical protein